MLIVSATDTHTYDAYSHDALDAKLHEFVPHVQCSLPLPLQLVRLERERESTEGALRSAQALVERQRAELTETGTHMAELESARDVLASELHARRQEVCTSDQYSYERTCNRKQ